MTTWRCSADDSPRVGCSSAFTPWRVPGSARPPAPSAPALPQPERPSDPIEYRRDSGAARPTSGSNGAGAETASNECTVIAAPGEPIATVALNDASIHRTHPIRRTRASDCCSVSSTRRWSESTATDVCGPGLAASWRLDADGRTWIVTLRENARFSDGTPVTAADVRASWTRDGSGDELRPHVSRLVESVAAVGDRSLRSRCGVTRATRQWRLPIPIWRSPSASPIHRGRSEHDPAGSRQTMSRRLPGRRR